MLVIKVSTLTNHQQEYVIVIVILIGMVILIQIMELVQEKGVRML